jgi:hypothetical protein
VGAAATVVLGALSAFWLVAVAPIPVALGAAWAVTRRFRPLAARAQLGLERALDHLERGAVKPAHALESGRGGVLGSLMEEVRRAIEGPK